uniref:ATP synthase subunit a n=1 Tax=Nipponoluciola cruciata TaxID=7051 RepID=T2HRB6_NIPCR|nr:ATP synthase F0 subunit 6 [Nipponoluciola cruciata]BAN82545.1 ATP synthase F0 subunit 6 [Nipponoluciola cruciata]BDE56950.1 ATPase subunit 6 [Nipponoluciola cruciata]
MMTNLFSSFDPSTSMNLSLNWMSILLGLIVLPSMFWIIPSRINFLWIKLCLILSNEFKIILKIKKMKSSTLIFVSLFSLILFNNVLSLFPYIFSSTSHLVLTLTLSLPLWLSFMIYGWMNNTTHMFAHLVPQGTPAVLMPFMVCIETISNIIRPGTLAIRLTANMIAGHLLLTLMGSTGNKLSLLMINMLIMSQLLLLLLESAVAIIQSYVFSILSTLYSSEVN